MKNRYRMKHDEPMMENSHEGITIRSVCCRKKNNLFPLASFHICKQNDLKKKRGKMNKRMGKESASNHIKATNNNIAEIQISAKISSMERIKCENGITK